MKRALFIGAVLGFASAVWSAPPGDTPSNGACGAVNVLNTAPTEVPCQNITTGKLINSCLIINQGPNVIYCNYSNTDGGAYLLDAGALTSVNWGIPLCASGCSWTFDMRLVRGATGTNSPQKIWCQAKTADQVTGETNTRFCGVR